MSLLAANASSWLVLAAESTPEGAWSWKSVLAAMAIALGVIAVALVVDTVFGRFIERVRAGHGPWRERVLGVAALLRLGVLLTVILILVAVALRLPTTLAKGIGLVLVLALAFASLDLLRNVIAGILLAGRRTFAVGDRIRIGDHEGEVRHVGLRSVALRTTEGTVVGVPSRIFLTRVVVNVGSQGRGAPIRVTVPIPEEMDIGAAKLLAYRAACVSKYASASDRPEVFVVQRSAQDRTYELEVLVRAFDGRFADHLRSDVLEILSDGLRQRGVQPARGDGAS